ncbi:uncharacterized protein LOC116890282 [Rattus rattus]|uniref:uncharacterized protein LOC116890282 n=1 Tax=Rattus rattus TaxID=10117 RepID=UPI0013F386BF|nr:uncharacterized protein LOC116890282 [Rattus rattus]
MALCAGFVSLPEDELESPVCSRHSANDVRLLCVEASGFATVLVFLWGSEMTRVSLALTAVPSPASIMFHPPPPSRWEGGRLCRGGDTHPVLQIVGTLEVETGRESFRLEQFVQRHRGVKGPLRSSRAWIS